MNQFWNWINGNKTTIGAIAMMVVNSEYVESIVTNPDLYTLAQSIAGAMLGFGLVHKAKKAMKKNDTA